MALNAAGFDLPGYPAPFSTSSQRCRRASWNVIDDDLHQER